MLSDRTQNRNLATDTIGGNELVNAGLDIFIDHISGVEIASEVADGPQSVIAEQVEMGVAVRMAVMEALLVSQNQGPRTEGVGA